MKNKVTLSSYHSLRKSLLKKGKAARREIIELYNYGSNNLKELKLLDDNYCHDNFRWEIRQVFNVDPSEFVRIATRIGGGRKKTQFERGLDILEAQPLALCRKAERALKEDAHKAFKDVSKKTPTVVIEKKVNKAISDIIKAAPKPKRKKGPTRPTYEQLEKENAKLRQENKRLKAEVKKYKAMIRKIKSEVA